VGDDPSRVSDDVRVRARLAIGVLEYTLGDHEAAQGTLAALLATPRDLLPPQVWSEAKIYVAEIYYMEGREEAAEATLREVLERDIDTPIYPYEHIGDIVLRYQLLRDSIVADRQQAAAAPRPLPAWGYAPFGVPQFKQDRPVRGATYALLQVGFAATSVGSWALIARLERQYGGDHRSDTEEEQAVAQAEIERARVLRSGLSFPSAAAFYLTWGASVLDGGLAWRRQRRIEMGVGVLPAPDGLHVVMGGRF
ncbi:MAG TPA: hypothetical protein PKA64_17145, partial [Myxococcota bacterium]|nr:hypothetical protein [Myxococcota bacterium]